MDETRRLSAIVVTDVVGYSQLVGRDESGTLAALKSLRSTLVEPLVGDHGGRIVKSMGDGLLVEFGSVVQATRFAVALQTRLAREARTAPTGARLALRVGIHQGDIVVDGDDILGDGVNVAARLQTLARPGGICVSQRTYEDVRDRLGLEFADGGEQKLKNIARVLRVWHWHPDGGPPGAAAAKQETHPGEGPALPIPDRPSIAVLPFTNLGDDPEHDYFADGLAEDLITELSRFRELFVIARNSTFVFKGTAVDIKDVGRRLGVQYVIEGSVRRTGSRVRVSAQLIEASGGRHVWAERYDRELADVFAAQDDLTASIVAAIAPAIDAHTRERVRRAHPGSMNAWEVLQRGLWHVYRYTKDDNHAAIAQFERAIGIDPQFAAAYAALGYAHYVSALWGFVADVPAAAKAALDSATKAVALDDRDAFARAVYARALMICGNVPAAAAEGAVAVDLNPNLASAHYALGFALAVSGQGTEALACVDRAIRLSPYDPLLHAFLTLRSAILTAMGRYDEALATAREAQRHANCTAWGWLQEAAALGNLERIGEARAALTRARNMKPDLSMAWVRSLFGGGEKPFQKYVRGLERAGLEG